MLKSVISILSPLVGGRPGADPPNQALTIHPPPAPFLR